MTALHPLVEQAGALIDIDRIDDARALLARRLAEDPTDAAAWVSLADCHLVDREYEEVLTATGEALALAPEYFDAQYFCARTPCAAPVGGTKRWPPPTRPSVLARRGGGLSQPSRRHWARGSRAGPRRSTRRRLPCGSARTRSVRTARCGRPR